MCTGASSLLVHAHRDETESALANFWSAPLSQVVAVIALEGLAGPAGRAGAGGDVQLIAGRDDFLQLPTGAVGEEALADRAGAGGDVQLIAGRDDCLQLLTGCPVHPMQTAGA